MALVVKDRVQELTTTSGTGTLTLSGAVPGYQTFSSSIGNGNTTFYTIYDNTAQTWEVGIGTVGAGTLARDTVLSNSLGTTAKISFAGNSSFVFCTYPAEQSINYDANDVATIGQTLGYADTGIVGSFASTVAGYNQVIVQNKSTATNASSNLNVSNDAGTAGSNYAELGINSSTFTGSGSFNIAGASYVASASTDLTLGTYGAYNVHFVTNSSTTDAMTIYNDGGISLGSFANPGMGNMAASKFVPGFTAVTSAAGTTVLTEDSNYYQNLLGSTTQTFQLPDATTLLVGTTFIFDNDSSGVLTVVDNASGPVETIPSGAAGFVYLAVNSTVAGTWRRHGFIPASYDFNATTANFGTATITNASWNGNTIGTAYGGTGLTTFGSANYALYSTSSSALVAGTLPTAAGGTGLTTYTTGDIIYASATNTLSKLAAGTNGYVLTLASGIPSWAANNAATTRTVNTFTATASQTTFTVSYTVGLIDVYRNGVKLAETDYTANNGTTVVLNTGANSGDTVETVAYSALSIGTGVTSFSTGTTGLTPTSGSGNITLAGTLNVANGGTGTSTAFTTGSVVFAGASGTYTQDNANFFWDDTNNRLGIGTTSPVSPLEVSTPLALNIRSTNTSALSTASGGFFVGSASVIPSAADQRIGGFAGAAYTTGTTYGTGAAITMWASEAWSSTSAASNIRFETAASGSTARLERMRIDSAGNVGIGTTTPIQKLTVWGTGTLPSAIANTQLLVGDTSGFANAGIALVTNAGNAASLTFGSTASPTLGRIEYDNTNNYMRFYTNSSERMRIDSSGNVGIGTSSPVTKLDIAATSNPRIRFEDTGDFEWRIGIVDGSSFGFFSAGTVTERMRIDSSGNVGIGTTSPAAKLTVNDSGTGLSFTNAASGSFNIGLLAGVGDASAYIYQRANSALIVGTNNTERMRIHASGGVSINNTSDPGAGNLTVTGKISDSKGDVRAAPIQSKTAAYVLVAADAGQTISITTGGVTVNASILSAGDMVSIFNNSGSSQTITQGASVTLRLSGTATTGNRTLAQYGVATLLCVIGGATPTFACTGAGLT